jgi:alpha-aminoadipate/glutamate carrier protein LysW
MVTCPLCDTEIDIDEEELDEGDLVTCDDCGAELRVIGLVPLELEPVEEEEEDDSDLKEEEDDEDEEEEDHWR